MDGDALAALLGRQIDDPAIAALLDELGASMPVKRKWSLRRAIAARISIFRWIARKRYEVVQTSNFERVVRKPLGTMIGFRPASDRKLLLCMASFWNRRAGDGFETFAGKLPHGLVWGATEAAVVEMFGNPIAGHRWLGLHGSTWSVSGHRLHCDFTERGELCRVSLHAT
jgi:hypothetical protein